MRLAKPFDGADETRIIPAQNIPLNGGMVPCSVDSDAAIPFVQVEDFGTEYKQGKLILWYAKPDRFRVG